MTRIDFYILPDQDRDARLQFACRLIDKAQRMGHQVFVNTRDQAQAEALNRRLWDFLPESFTPHRLLDGEQPPAPVAIGYSEDCGDHHDVLINLGGPAPAYFSRFERLTEVVIQEETVLADTRDNYKFYRDRGYPIQSHDMRSR